MLLLLIACNSEGYKQPDLDHDDDGFTVTEKDCDDTNNHIYPNADDVVGDDEDRNCDGVDGVDADGDGWASQASGGTDCNDEDTGIPGTESYNNNIDDNCNGCIDEPVWTLGIVSSPGISQIIVDTFHKDRQKFDFSFGFIQGNYRSESCEDGHSNCHIGSDTLTLDVVSSPEDVVLGDTTLLNLNDWSALTAMLVSEDGHCSSFGQDTDAYTSLGCCFSRYP